MNKLFVVETLLFEDLLQLTSNLTLGLIDCHVVCESNGELRKNPFTRSEQSNLDQPFGEYRDIIIIIIAILTVIFINVLQSSRSSAHFALGPLASVKYMGSTRGRLGPDD